MCSSKRISTVTSTSTKSGTIRDGDFTYRCPQQRPQSGDWSRDVCSHGHLRDRRPNLNKVHIHSFLPSTFSTLNPQTEEKKGRKRGTEQRGEAHRSRVLVDAQLVKVLYCNVVDDESGRTGQLTQRTEHLDVVDLRRVRIPTRH